MEKPTIKEDLIIGCSRDYLIFKRYKLGEEKKDFNFIKYKSIFSYTEIPEYHGYVDECFDWMRNKFKEE